MLNYKMHSNGFKERKTITMYNKQCIAAANGKRKFTRLVHEEKVTLKT